MDGIMASSPPLHLSRRFAYDAVIDEICGLGWETLDRDAVMRVAAAYYYFSVQFRENLEIACGLLPRDRLLQKLRTGECDTDNLSPWPGIAAPGERLDHDAFMRRLLIRHAAVADPVLAEIGASYLAAVRRMDPTIRAASIASYEDGGLCRVFRAILRAPEWHDAGPRGFRFFLEQHILFDSDEKEGHGALSRHLQPDDRILPLWVAFRDILVAAVPQLAAAAAAFPAFVQSQPDILPLPAA